MIKAFMKMIKNKELDAAIIYLYETYNVPIKDAKKMVNEFSYYKEMHLPISSTTIGPKFKVGQHVYSKQYLRRIFEIKKVKKITDGYQYYGIEDYGYFIIGKEDELGLIPEGE